MKSGHFDFVEEVSYENYCIAETQTSDGLVGAMSAESPQLSRDV